MSIPYETDDSEDEYQNPNEEDEDEIEDEDSDEDDEELADEGVRGQLSDISFGELQKLKETVGLKKYNEAVFGKKAENDEVDDGGGNKRKDLKRKLTNEKVDGEKKKKSEPEEMSSKKQKGKPRNVVENVKRRHRDPRFDNLSGTFNDDMFQKSYSFVDEMKKDELKMVKKQFKKARNKEEKSSLHKLLQRMEEQEKVNELKAKRKENEKKRKKEEYEARSAGKKVFYLKKKEAKKLELLDQYKKLKESGKVDKVLNRKRKVNASKQKKKFVKM